MTVTTTISPKPLPQEQERRRHAWEARNPIIIEDDPPDAAQGKEDRTAKVDAIPVAIDLVWEGEGRGWVRYKGKRDIFGKALGGSAAVKKGPGPGRA